MTSPKHFAPSREENAGKAERPEINLTKEQQIEALNLLQEYLDLPKGPEPEKRARRQGYFYKVEKFLSATDPRDSSERV